MDSSYKTEFVTISEKLSQIPLRGVKSFGPVFSSPRDVHIMSIFYPQTSTATMQKLRPLPNTHGKTFWTALCTPHSCS